MKADTKCLLAGLLLGSILTLMLLIGLGAFQPVVVELKDCTFAEFRVTSARMSNVGTVTLMNPSLVSCETYTKK